MDTLLILVSTLVLSSIAGLSAGSARSNEEIENIGNEAHVNGANDLMQMRAELDALKFQMAKAQRETEQLRTEVDASTEASRDQTLKSQSEIQQLRAELETAKTDSRTNKRGTGDTKLSGSTYIRWGRTTCEGDARVVYRGYAAGPHHLSQGSGANFLCLHEKPKFGKYQYGMQTHMGHIYGVTYAFHGFNSFVFSAVNNDGHPFDKKPAPCVVCHIPNRLTNLMIPARNVCPSGWTMEYRGYVVSEFHGFNRHRSNYICWDESPETVPGGTSEWQTVVSAVQIGCGALPCSTFIDGLELTCVVCSI